MTITRILMEYGDLNANAVKILDEEYKAKVTRFEKGLRDMKAMGLHPGLDSAYVTQHNHDLKLISVMRDWWLEFEIEVICQPDTEPLILDDAGNFIHREFFNICGIKYRKETKFVIYQDCVYEIKGNYSREQMKLLVLEHVDKERLKFENLHRKFSGEASEEINYTRERIPEDVRIAVWRRDQGKCARCGSREKLEYDHIVPVSKGGGNTVRNIELLCQNCNRQKSNKVG